MSADPTLVAALCSEFIELSRSEAAQVLDECGGDLEKAKQAVRDTLNGDSSDEEDGFETDEEMKAELDLSEDTPGGLGPRATSQGSAAKGSGISRGTTLMKLQMPPAPDLSDLSAEDVLAEISDPAIQERILEMAGRADHDGISKMLQDWGLEDPGVTLTVVRTVIAHYTEAKTGPFSMRRVAKRIIKKKGSSAAAGGPGGPGSRRSSSAIDEFDDFPLYCPDCAGEVLMETYTRKVSLDGAADEESDEKMLEAAGMIPPSGAAGAETGSVSVKKKCAINSEMVFCPGLSKWGVEDTSVFRCPIHKESHRMFCQDCGDRIRRLGPQMQQDCTMMSCCVKTTPPAADKAADKGKPKSIVCEGRMQYMEKKDNVKCVICNEKQTREYRFECSIDADHVCCVNPICVYVFYQTAKYRACVENWEKHLKQILTMDSLFNIHFQPKKGDGTLLHVFAKKGILKAVKMMCSQSGTSTPLNYDITNRMGLTPLQVAQAQCGACIFSNQHDLVSRRKITDLANQYHRVYGMAGTLKHFLMKSCEELTNLEKVASELSTGVLKPYDFVLDLLRTSIYQMIESRKSFPDALFVLVCDYIKRKESEERLTRTEFWRGTFKPFLEKLLHFENLHLDKTGWTWFQEVFMGSPIWLELGGGAVEMDVRSGEEAPILYDDLVAIVENQVRNQKDGLREEMRTLIESDKTSWAAITRFEFLPTESKSPYDAYRQDEMDLAITRDLAFNYEELSKITLVSKSGDYSAVTEFDSHSVMNNLIIMSHAVDHQFQDSIKNAMISQIKAGTAKFQAGPVKALQRCAAKAELEYKDRPFPKTCQIIDLVRCSLTYKSLAHYLEGINILKETIIGGDAGAVVDIMRVKNGFSKFKVDDPEEFDPPDTYRDLKFNVVIRGQGEFSKFGIIGEVQFLLKPMLNTKKKNHELYEILRSAGMFQGAKQSVKTFELNKSETIAKDARAFARNAVHNSFPLDATSTDVESWTILHSQIEKFGGKGEALAEILGKMHKATILAELNTPDREKRTPLMLALERGISSEAIAYLLRDPQKIEWNRKDSKMRTYVHILMDYVDDEKMILQVLEAMDETAILKSMNSVDEFQRTPFTIALVKGHTLSVVKQIVPDKKDFNWTALISTKDPIESHFSAEESGTEPEKFSYLEIVCNQYAEKIEEDPKQRVHFQDFLEFMGIKAVGSMLAKTNALVQMFAKKLPWTLIEIVLDFMSSFEWEDISRSATFDDDGVPLMHIVVKNYGEEKNFLSVLRNFPKSILAGQLNERDSENMDTPLMLLLQKQKASLDILMAFCGQSGPDAVSWNTCNKENRYTLSLLAQSCDGDSELFLSMLEYIGKEILSSNLTGSAAMVDLLQSGTRVEMMDVLLDFIGAKASSSEAGAESGFHWYEVTQQVIEGTTLLHAVTENYCNSDRFTEILSKWLPEFVIETQMNIQDSKGRTPLMITLATKEAMCISSLKLLVAHSPDKVDWSLCDENKQSYLNLFYNAKCESEKSLIEMFEYCKREQVRKMVCDGHGFLDLFRNSLDWAKIKEFMKYWGFEQMPWDVVEADRIDNLCLLHCICQNYRSQVSEILPELPNTLVFSQINAQTNDDETPLLILLADTEQVVSLAEIQMMLRQENAMNWTFTNASSGYLSLLCLNVQGDVKLLSELFDFIGKPVIAYLFHHTVALTQMFEKGVKPETITYVIKYLSVDAVHWRRLQNEQDTLLHAALASYTDLSLWNILNNIFPESLITKQRELRDKEANTALQVACRHSVLTVELLRLLVADFDKFDWTYRNLKDKKKRSYLAWIASNCKSDAILFKDLMNCIGRDRVMELFDPVEALIEMMNGHIDFKSIELFVEYCGPDNFTLEALSEKGALFMTWMAENCKGDIVPLVEMARSDDGPTVLSTDVLELMHMKMSQIASFKTKRKDDEEDASSADDGASVTKKVAKSDLSDEDLKLITNGQAKHGAGKSGFIEIWRGEFDESGSWSYSGSKDAIAFKCSAPMMLMGTAVFLGSGKTSSQVTVYEGENNSSGKKLSESERKEWKFSDQPKHVESLMLKSPIFLEPDVKYTLELDQTTDNYACRIKNGKESTSVGDVKITWMAASSSPNSTGIYSGALPLIYLASPTFLLSAGELKTQEMGAVGDTLKISRGIYSAPSVFDWFHEGKKAALQIKVQENCILEGIGIFCGEGETKVDVRVKGMNKIRRKMVVLGGTAKTKTFMTPSAAPQPASVFFDDPVLLSRGVWYTVEVTQTCEAGCPSYFIEDGCERITVDGFGMQLKDASSEDLTSVHRGSIPTFYFLKVKEEEMVRTKSSLLGLVGGAITSADQEVEEIKRSESKSTVWYYSGGSNNDALAITSNIEWVLRGVGVWKAKGETRVEVCIWLGDNDGDESNIISRTGVKTIISDTQSDEPEEVPLPTPLTIEPDTKYTVEIRQKSEPCFHVTGGKDTSECSDDLVVTWSAARNSRNGTSVGRGAIPVLYRMLADPATIEAQKTVKRMGGTGPPIVIERGEYVPRTNAYSNKRCGIKFKVSEICLFEGLGILVCSAKTTVDMALILGDNDQNEVEFKDRILTSDRFLYENKDKSRVPIPSRVKKPVLLDPEKEYTLEFTQYNSTSETEQVFCLSSGVTSVRCNSLCVTFSDAKFCEDSTATATSGGVPAMIFRAFDPFSVKEKPEGEISCVMRGTVDDDDGFLYTDGDSRPDAIAFKADRSFLMTGVGFYPCMGTTQVKAYIFLGDNPDKGDIKKGRCVASCTLKEHEQTERATSPIPLPLDAPLLVRPQTKYTIQLHQTNVKADTALGIEDGRKTVTQDGTMITFMAAHYSPNGTNVDHGAIPCIYGEFFTKSKAKAIDLGAIGSSYLMPRGGVAEKDEKDKRLEKGWPCDGKLNALCLESTTTFVLQGIGVNLPVGESTVSITVYVGSNKRDDSLASRMVGQVKDVKFKEAKADKQPKKVLLATPFLVEANVKYTVEMAVSTVSGAAEGCYFITNGTSLCDFSRFEISFSNADYSPGGTTVRSGLIPALVAFETVGSKLAQSDLIANNLLKIAEAPGHSKLRGKKINSESEASWGHEGKHDALQITVSKRVVLRGVGVFCCQGETKASCILTYTAEPWISVAPFCICGFELTKMKAKDPYGWSLGCDKCGASKSGDEEVYHCSRGRVEPHSGGYDLCSSCGRSGGSGSTHSQKQIAGAAPMTKYTSVIRESEPRELRFAFPVVLEPGIDYTLDLHQTVDGGLCSYIQDGQSSVDYSDVIPELIVEYSSSSASENGTDTMQGALPNLYFVDYAELLSECEKKVFAIGAVGETISVKRGEQVSDPTRAAQFTGDYAIGLKPFNECILEGISVFVGKNGSHIKVGLHTLNDDGTLGEKIGGTKDGVDLGNEFDVSLQPQMVRFSTPALLKPKVKYVVKVHQLDVGEEAPQCYVKNGRPMLLANALVIDTFTVSDKLSPNGTTVDIGSLSTFHFRETHNSSESETLSYDGSVIQIDRFDSISESTWYYSGSKDALCFTNDGINCYLRGIGIFLCDGTTNASVEIKVSGKVVAQSKREKFEGKKTTTPQELKLKSPYLWKKGVKIDVVLSQQSNPCCYGSTAKSGGMTGPGGLKFSTSGCSESSNGTGTNMGALPCLYIVDPTKEEKKEEEKELSPYELVLQEMGANLVKSMQSCLRGKVVTLADAEADFAKELKEAESEAKKTSDGDSAGMDAMMGDEEDEDEEEKGAGDEAADAEEEEETPLQTLRPKWTHDEDCMDAIKFSVDTSVILEAVGVFYGRKLTVIRGRIIEGDNREGIKEKDSKIVARFENKRFVKNVKTIGDEPFPVMLDSPLLLVPDKEYTIELFQRNSDGCLGQYIKSGKPTVTHELGVTFEFDDAIYSPNDTTTSEGVIPSLYFRPLALASAGGGHVFGFPIESVTRGAGTFSDVRDWRHSGGEKDAVCFVSDKMFGLRGIGIFACAGVCEAQVFLYEGDNGDSESAGKKIAKSRKQEFSNKERPEEPLELSFEEVVMVKPGQKYTVELCQTNMDDEDCGCVVNCKAVQKLESGVTLTWSSAEKSENGTDQEEGAIASLFVAIFDDFTIESFNLGGIGKTITFSRGGEITAPSDSDWKCQPSKIDALKIGVSRSCILEGIGVFPGSVGESKAKVTVLKGDVKDGSAREVLAESDEMVFTRDPESELTDYVKLRLKSPLVLKEEIGYTLELCQTNAAGSCCAFVTRAPAATTQSRISVEFSDSESSTNGTTVVKGLIPCLYLRNMPNEEDDLSQAIVIERGTIADESGRWNHSGSCDAIAFTLDKPLFMRGIGVLCCSGSINVTVRLYKGSNSGGEKIAESELTTFESDTKSLEAKEVRFKKLTKVEADQLYTAEIEQRNSGGVSAVTKCGSSTTVETSGYTCTFSRASNSPNGTGTSEGAIPTLYFVTNQEFKTALDRTLFKLGAGPEDIHLTRGPFTKQIDKWMYTSSKSALLVRSEENLILASVGVFVADGLTSAKIQAFEGVKPKDASAEEWKAIGGSKMHTYTTDSEDTESGSTYVANVMEPAVLPLDKPFLLRAGETYTLELNQQNPEGQSSRYVSGGYGHISVPGAVISIGNAPSSEDGTSIEEGAFAFFNFRVCMKEELAKEASVMKSETSKQKKSGVVDLAAKDKVIPVIRSATSGPVAMPLKVERGTVGKGSGRWNHNGSMDALSFTIKGPSDITLTHVGFFAPEGECTIKYVKIFEGKNGSSADSVVGGISDERILKFKAKMTDPQDLRLDKPILIKCDQKYTVEVKQMNGSGVSCYIEGGKSSMSMKDGYSISFTRAEKSDNGTSVSDGAIPTLTFDMKASKAQQMGAIGDQLSFWNGVPTSRSIEEAGSMTKGGPESAAASAAASIAIPKSKAEVLTVTRTGDIEMVEFVSDTPLIIEGCSVFAGSGKNEYEIFLYRKDDGKPSEGQLMEYNHTAHDESILCHVEFTEPMLVDNSVWVLEVKQTSANPVAYARDGFYRCMADDVIVTYADVHEKSMVGGLLAYKLKSATKFRTVKLSTVDVSTMEKHELDLDTMGPVIASAQARILERGTHISDDSGIWNHSGNKDAIEFKTNKSFILRGVGALCCAGSITLTVRIYQGRNDYSGEVVAQSDKTELSFPEKQMNPTEVKLREPLFIEKDVLYTVEFEQRNSGGVSAVVKGGQSTTEHGDITLTWSSASSSPNGTGTSQGSIPCLYIVQEVITSEFAKKILKMGGSKELNEVIRGQLKEQSEEKWKHTGEWIDSVQVEADTSCILDSVGIFAGRGTTRVRARAYPTATRPEQLPLFSTPMEIFNFHPSQVLSHVQLPEPVFLMPGIPVTIELDQTNELSNSWYVAQGDSSVTVKGITYTFSDSLLKDSMTTASEGSIPAIYTRPLRKGEELDNLSGVTQKEVTNMSHFISLFEPTLVFRGDLTYETGRWTHYGQQDAINFKTDTDCILRGIGVFPSKEAPTNVEGAVYVLEKGSKSIRGCDPVAKIEKHYYESPYLGKDPIELQFEEPLLVTAQTMYTIVLEQKNDMGPSRFITKGKSVHKVPFSDGSGELEVRFSQSKDSFNSTDVDEGAIPVLYFVSKSSVLSEWGKKAAKLQCGSERLVFSRGSIEDQPKKKWKCTGGGEMISIKVDKSCIFEGIGILPGKGRTEAKLTVTLPEKDIMALAILHQDEEDAVGDLSEMVLGRTRRQTHARRGSISRASGRIVAKGDALGVLPLAEAEEEEVKGADEADAGPTSRRMSRKKVRKETTAEPPELMIPVAEGNAVFNEEEKPGECRVLRLDKPILLEEGYVYTLELTQTNDKNELSCFARNCEKKVTVSGINLEFMDAKTKKGRTSTREGQFAEIYLRSRELASAALAQAMLFTEAMQMWRGETRNDSGRWNCNGSMDAIAFTSNQDMMIRGVGIYCVGDTTKIEYMKLYEGDNGGSDDNVVAEVSHLEWKFDSKQEKPVEARFTAPVMIKADQKYTVEIMQRNGRSLVSCFVKGKGGSSYTTEHEHGYALTWTRANRSNNGTGTDEGAIPCLYCLNPFAEMSEEDRKVFELGGEGLPIAITRGDFSSEPNWVADGKQSSALCIRPDKTIILEGFGLFVGAKGGVAKVKVFRGSNESEGKPPAVMMDEVAFANPKDCSIPQVVTLSDPIIVEEQELITVEIALTNHGGEQSYSVSDGHSIVFDESVSLEFSTARVSLDSTSSSKGNIPRVYLRKCKVEEKEETAAGSEFWTGFDVATFEETIAESQSVIEVMRGDCESYSSWNHSGPNDCITFEVSEPCIIRGIGVYCAEGETRADVKVYKNGTTVVAKAEQRSWKYDSQQDKPVEMTFEKPLLAEAKTPYKIELHQVNDSGKQSHCISDGKSSVSVKDTGLTIKFSSASGSNNGTDVGDGAIPSLYILTQSTLVPQWRKELDQKLKRLSAGGKSLCIERGRFFKEKDKWLLNNYLSALKFKVDTEVVLEGIALLSGKGTTKVAGRIWKGDNDKYLEWGNTEDPRIVAVIEDQTFKHMQRQSLPDCAYLRDPLLLEIGEWYTIELKQLNEHGEPSFFVKNGEAEVKEGGMTVTYATANHVCDGTSVKKGAIPGIYVRKIVGSERSTEAEFSVSRGDYKSGDMRWAYRGEGRKDAVCLTVDYDIDLFGVGAFLGAGNTRVTVNIYKGDNTPDAKPLVSSGTKVFYREMANETPIEVPLLSKVSMTKNEKYTVEVIQENSRGQYSYFVENGLRESKIPPVTFAFSNAFDSSNGTSLSQGAIPVLFWDSEEARESLSARATIMRGKPVEESGVWNYSGNLDSIALEVTQQTTLLGIGIFTCDGTTKVEHVKIFEGTNTEGKMIGGTMKEHSFDGSKSLEPVPLIFGAPVVLAPSKEYTIELKQINSGGQSCLITDGESESEGPLGLKVKWKRAAKSSNGTGLKRGAIPCIYVGGGEVSMAKKFAGDTGFVVANANDLLDRTLFANGEFPIFRGPIAESADWGHDKDEDEKQSADAIDFRVTSHDMILHGIGVFVPADAQCKVRFDIQDETKKSFGRSKEETIKADDRSRVSDPALPVRLDLKNSVELEKGKWYTIVLHQLNSDEAPSHSIEPGMAEVITRGVKIEFRDNEELSVNGTEVNSGAIPSLYLSKKPSSFAPLSDDHSELIRMDPKKVKLTRQARDPDSFAIAKFGDEMFIRDSGVSLHATFNVDKQSGDTALILLSEEFKYDPCESKPGGWPETTDSTAVWWSSGHLCRWDKPTYGARKTFAGWKAGDIISVEVDMSEGLNSVVVQASDSTDRLKIENIPFNFQLGWVLGKAECVVSLTDQKWTA